MNIVLLGPPGAGKGTQAKLLVEFFGLSHISTGNLLRKSVEDNTSLGNKVKEIMAKGDLVPDDIVVELLKERLSNLKINDGFILDGFPRNVLQAEILDKILNDADIILNYVIYLEADKPIIIQRLSGRRVCNNCQANFHNTNMPPKKEGVCDGCGGSLYQRDDDKEDAIENRLLVYLQKTKSLVDYYMQQSKLLKIDANFDASVVFEKFKSVLA